MFLQKLSSLVWSQSPSAPDVYVGNTGRISLKHCRSIYMQPQTLILTQAGSAVYRIVPINLRQNYIVDLHGQPTRYFQTTRTIVMQYKLLCQITSNQNYNITSMIRNEYPITLNLRHCTNRILPRTLLAAEFVTLNKKMLIHEVETTERTILRKLLGLTKDKEQHRRRQINDLYICLLYTSRCV